MTSWLDADGAAIDAFVQARRFRTDGSRTRYAQILRGFTDFMASCDGPRREARRADLEAWLRSRYGDGPGPRSFSALASSAASWSFWPSAN